MPSRQVIKPLRIKPPPRGKVTNVPRSMPPRATSIAPGVRSDSPPPKITPAGPGFTPTPDALRSQPPYRVIDCVDTRVWLPNPAAHKGGPLVSRRSAPIATTRKVPSARQIVRPPGIGTY